MRTAHRSSGSTVPRGQTILSALLLLGLPAGRFFPINEPAAPALTIYVSTAGNDRNPGTAEAPVRTPARAQQLVRGLNADMMSQINVFLEPGLYRLSSPLVLSPRDSGTNGFSVVWMADPDSVTVTGADQIGGWTLFNGQKNIWSARTPASLRTREIYVNGERATLASGRPPVSLSRWWNGYEAATPVMSRWRNPSEIDFVYTAQTGLMAEPICPVASMSGRIINMAEPCWANSTRRRTNLVGYGTLELPSYIEGAYELLTKPGQFYLDDTAHRLFYIPRPGQDMASADVQAPALQRLIFGHGTVDDPIHNITFANIQFSYATWLQPSSPQGFSEVQAGYTLTGSGAGDSEGLCHLVSHGRCPYGAWTEEPGNIQFQYDNHIDFVGDEFVHMGAAGLSLADGSQNGSVIDCVFDDISGNGVELGAVDKPTAAPDSQTADDTVEDNHVYDIGEEYHGGVGILVGYAADIAITHNQLDDLPYSAISIGWGGWLDKVGKPSVANYSHGNVVSDNLIFDYVEMLSDGGGVYTLGVTGSSMATGEKIIGNVIHNQLNWSYALHSDNGATFVTNSTNVLYDNTYDWAGNHTDYAPSSDHPGKYRDPQAVIHNYWQQGDPPYSDRTVSDRGNHVIDGPSQAPVRLVGNAGIIAPFTSVLAWHPSGTFVPSQPERVSVLYAFKKQAYVSWLPAFADGDAPVASYTVQACRLSSNAGGSCLTANEPSESISEDDYLRLGYVIVPGLVDGDRYEFTVIANSPSGQSTPSLPSPIIVPRSRAPGLDGRVPVVDTRPGKDTVVLTWYPPPSTDCDWSKLWCNLPILYYQVTTSTHSNLTASSISQLVVSNHSGKVLFVVGGLTPNRPYTFTVRPETPGGLGLPNTSGPVKPDG